MLRTAHCTRAGPRGVGAPASPARRAARLCAVKSPSSAEQQPAAKRDHEPSADIARRLVASLCAASVLLMTGASPTAALDQAGLVPAAQPEASLTTQQLQLQGVPFGAAAPELKAHAGGHAHHHDAAPAPQPVLTLAESAAPMATPEGCKPVRDRRVAYSNAGFDHR